MFFIGFILQFCLKIKIAGTSKKCFDIALALKKIILAMAQLYKPLVGERPILLARVQIKSFWQGIFQPAILLARIQSLSACWTRKSPTAFHRHPYFFSDQGWFSHLVMIGQASMPSSLHSLQMDVLSSKIWPVPICWHQTPLPYGPQRDLVTPVKLNWTYLFPLPK